MNSGSRIFLNLGGIFKTSADADLWVKAAVLNFCIVAFLGMVMRLNFVFRLPLVTHTFLLDAHSHFALYGWVTSCIYIFAARYVQESPGRSSRRYNLLMVANLAGSYGMLFSFLYGGYFAVSIAFSSVSLFAGFYYCFLIFSDTKNCNSPEVKWFRAGGLFAVLSAAGIFGVAYFSRDKTNYEQFYRASTYFYLHFQYNGFFLFSCIGIMLTRLRKLNLHILKKRLNLSFYLLLAGTVLSYGLSLLWLHISRPILLLLGFSALVQLAGAILLLSSIRKREDFVSLGGFDRMLYMLAAVFSLKFLLQALSVLPFFQAACSDRNVVVAYLHLVLLVLFTVFFLWLIAGEKRCLHYSGYLLVFAIVFNEILLMLKAAGSVFAVAVPFSNLLLLLVSAVILLAGGNFLWRIINLGQVHSARP